MIDPSFAVSLADAYQTPLYCYDLAEVERRTGIIVGALPEGGSLYFSLKSNPFPALGEAVNQVGGKAEVCSEGELDSAIAAGFKVEEMLYSGPGKNPVEIQYAIAKGVRQFSCESWIDLDRLSEGACEADATITVLLRLNPLHPSKALLAMSGVASQFGFEENLVFEGKEKIKSLPKQVRVFGIHIYYGTQIAGRDAFVSASKDAVDSAERVAEALDLDLEVLDLGGGFAWPFTSDDAGSDMDWLPEAVAEISAHRRRTSSARIWFESGRYLVASSGTLLLRVLDVKSSKENKQFVVLDGGINVLGGMSGLGRIARVTAKFNRVTRQDDADGEEQYDFVGPLCSPLDCLARNLQTNRLQVNDIVSIPNVGAYGLSASLIYFLSRPLPVEVAYRDGAVTSAYSTTMKRDRI